MESILPESLEREIAAMTTDQKRSLAAALRRMIAEEMSPVGDAARQSESMVP
ncbi:MAG: hypothetical protein J6D54_13045 [Olsenella sp.]|nr:hypothetical protein [Olsenella sp.]